MKYAWCVLVRTLFVLGLLAICAVSGYTLDENDLDPHEDISVDTSKSAYPIQNPSIYNLFSAYLKSRANTKERAKRQPLGIAGLDNIHFLMSNQQQGGGGGRRRKPKQNSDSSKVSVEALRKLFLAGR